LQTCVGSPIVGEIAFLHHQPSATEVLAERAFLRALGGGCQVPVGALAYAEKGNVRLIGIVADTEGKQVLRDELSGAAEEAEELGESLARRLLQAGADKLLNGRFLPLSGRRIMITRPRDQAGPLVRGVEALGSQVIEFPTIQIVPPESYVPMDKAIEGIKEYDWIVFTSVKGVREFMNRLRHLGRSVKHLDGIRLAAIGPETAKRISSEGLKVELIPAEYRSEGLLHGVKPEEVRGKRFLLPRAAVARDVLPRTLREWGAEVDVVQAYRTVPVKGNATWLRETLDEKMIDMVTFTSSSSVNHFFDSLPKKDRKKLLNGVAVACIGPITRKTAEENGMRVDVVAKEYTVMGLIQAIAEHFSSKPVGTQ
jgi:uroporphyrinogen III methyltransferase/synthase